jgi:hypothetical protein
MCRVLGTEVGGGDVIVGGFFETGVADGREDAEGAVEVLSSLVRLTQTGPGFATDALDFGERFEGSVAGGFGGLVEECIGGGEIISLDDQFRGQQSEQGAQYLI